MQPILTSLNQNLQVVYRKALDADRLLTQLQQSGKGKFKQVFAEDAGFSARSNRFMPYVEELAGAIASLDEKDDAAIQQGLPEIVRKIQLILTTLTSFQQSLRD